MPEAPGSNLKQSTMRRFLIVFILLPAALAHAQDITGVWQGHFHATNQSERSSLLVEARYKFEVQIAQKDKAFDAVTYSYLSSFFYGKAAANGTVNPKTGKVLLQEGKLLEFRNGAGDDVCIMTCFLQYSKSGDEEFLEGSYTSMSVRDSSNCGRGTVFLRKVTASDFYKEPFVAKREEEIAAEKAVKEKVALKKPTPAPKKPTATTAAAGKKNTPANAKPNTGVTKPAPVASTATKPPVNQKPTPRLSRVNTPNQLQPVLAGDSAPGMGISRKFAIVTPEVLLSRSNELVRTIVVNTNEVVLNIYDDGAIDNDTISVFLDKKQVISHAMISDKAIVLTLHMDDNSNYHELVMVADNEGEIPPNTSLMIVKAGDQRYEVRISSSLQKNAVIVFKYEKPK